jgi:hypothetical protein
MKRSLDELGDENFFTGSLTAFFLNCFFNLLLANGFGAEKPIVPF